MSNAPKIPHDSLFRHTFGLPSHAQALLQHALPPPLLELINWTTLRSHPPSFVDDEQKPVHSDLLFEVQAAGHPLLLYVLVEHQNQSDRWLPLWLFNSMRRIWEWFCLQAPQMPSTLPDLVPLVVYHGVEPWQTPLSFAELFGPASPQFAAHFKTPDFIYELLDLHVTPDEELQFESGTLTMLTLLALKHGRSVDPWSPLLREGEAFAQLLRAPAGLMHFRFLWRYLCTVAQEPPPRALYATWRQSLPREAQEVLANDIEPLQQESRKDLSERLCAQLLDRFGELPEPIQTRIIQADEAHLQTWSSKLFNARSPQDIFS